MEEEMETEVGHYKGNSEDSELEENEEIEVSAIPIFGYGKSCVILGQLYSPSNHRLVFVVRHDSIKVSSQYEKESRILLFNRTNEYFEVEKQLFFSSGMDFHPKDVVLLNENVFVCLVGNISPTPCPDKLVNYDMKSLSPTSEISISQFFPSDIINLNTFEKMYDIRNGLIGLIDEQTLVILSLREKKCLYTTNVGIGWNSRIIASKRFENCFFMTSSKLDGGKVKLIDYRTEETVKIFNKHNGKRMIPSVIGTFIDRHSNDEILYVGGFEKRMFFYNTRKKSVVLIIVMNFSAIGSSVIINRDEYLAVGSYGVGLIDIFSLEVAYYQRKNKKRSVNMKIKNYSDLHNDGIFGIYYLGKDGNTSIELVTICQVWGTACIVKMSNLPVLDSVIRKNDLRERTNYLHSDSIKKTKETRYIARIRLKNTQIHVFNSLLLFS